MGVIVHQRKILLALAAFILVLAPVQGWGETTLKSTSAPLRSPWSAAKSAPGKVKYNCPKPAPLPRDIVATQYYNDAKKSVIDPVAYAAYNAVEAIFDEQMGAVASAADAYRRSGNPAAVDCAVQLLKTAATSDAMTGSMSANQAYYLQNWTLGSLATSYLKVQPSGLVSAQDNATITAWMLKVGWQVESYFEPHRQKKTMDGRNNHIYWAGFAAMAAAIAGNDHKLFDWGASTYADGVDAIQPDGTLPLEMDRGQRALHYHLFAVTPLVMMAEFGEDNGLPMYAANNGALHLLARRCLTGLANNSYFAAKTGIKQDTPEGGKIQSLDVYWAVPYVKRFPNASISALVNSVQITPGHFLGGLPPQ